MIFRILPTRHLAKFALLGCFLHSEASAAISIQIETSHGTDNYDPLNFFGTGSAARARLDDAAAFFEGILEDDLDAITPTEDWGDGPDSWEVDFKNPSNVNNTAFIGDLSVPADTIIIFVGSQNFSGSQLAQAGFGGATTFAFPAFNTTVSTRGESGVGTTDFAPWGGYLSVDDDTTWDTGLVSNGTDQHLYSTLLHEIGHVLGLGTAASWDAQITSGEFTGSESVSENGGSEVPLHFNSSNSRYDHWAAGTTSDIYGTSTSQEAAMDPDIVAGTAKLFTALDVAGLDDIGWDIAAPVPEPSSAFLAVLSAATLLLRRRRQL